jgi:hypothetical protein
MKEEGVSLFKVYLDTCVYCRPFDDQSQERIALETEAFASILESSNIIVIGSDVLDDEIFRIEEFGVRLDVRGFTGVCKERVELTDAVVQRASGLMDECGFKAMDALHLASAVSNAVYFITSDVEIIKKKDCVKENEIVDPIGFAEEFLWK